jgi:hypothetical protein
MGDPAGFCGKQGSSCPETDSSNVPHFFFFETPVHFRVPKIIGTYSKDMKMVSSRFLLSA